MNVHRVMLQDGTVDYQFDLLQAIVDHCQRRHGARPDTQETHEPLGLAEGQAPAAELVAQCLQIDLPVFRTGDQPHGALLVAQKEVLGMAARQLAPQFLGLLDRKERSMSHDLVVYAQLLEALEELLRGEGLRAVLQPPFDFRYVMHGAGRLAAPAVLIKSLASLARKRYSPCASLADALPGAGVAQG